MVPCAVASTGAAPAGGVPQVASGSRGCNGPGSEAGSAAARPAQRRVVLLPALLLAALLPRASGLGATSLWVDEAATAWFAALPLADLLGTFLWLEPNQPTYCLFIRSWDAIAGATEQLLRRPTEGALAAAVLQRLMVGGMPATELCPGLPDNLPVHLAVRVHPPHDAVIHAFAQAVGATAPPAAPHPLLRQFPPPLCRRGSAPLQPG